MMSIKRAFAAMLLLIVAFSVHVTGQDFNGNWSGEISVGNSSLTLVFNIQQTDESVKVAWSVPQQGAFDIPVPATISGNELTVDIPMSGASFKGTLKGDAIEGTFFQNSMNFPLKLVQTEDVRKQRPQEAAIEADNNKPYRCEEVSFTNDGITFAGTLTLPESGSRFPAVVLVAGSGAFDRDEEVFGHKPFLLIADALSRNGFAVLRYDERGVGATKGGYPFAPTESLATDAMAALRYLKARPDVDAGRVGFVGHSEGGMIAIMNAAKHPDEVAYIVSLAGTGVNGFDLANQQMELGLKARGIEAYPGLMKLAEESNRIICTEKDSTILRERLCEFFKTHEQDPFMQLFKGGMDLEQVLDMKTNPMIRCVFQYDPTENLKRVKCPMLAVNGKLDCQVACEENLNAISSLVPHATVIPYEGLNHFFQTCDDWLGSFNYGMIPETMSPVVLKDVTEWLKNTVKK